MLSGTEGSPLTGSARTFTSSSAYKVSHTYDFKVEIFNQTTGAVITTKTFRLTYRGPPA